MRMIHTVGTQRLRAAAALITLTLVYPTISIANELSPVAEDVLFLVLGKMSLYDQNSNGDIRLRNHHFVAEIMPRAGRRILSGTLTSDADPNQIIEFQSEGAAFLAHGARVMQPDELHRLHPDGDYIFSYKTENGAMPSQRLKLSKRATTRDMPAAARILAAQNSKTIERGTIDPNVELTLTWDSMQGNTRVANSELDDLIFVLGFDCFGNNVVHSGRPYQGGPYLTYADTSFEVPAESLEPGLRYTFIVEQATADVQTYKGVPGISTYATLTFVSLQTTGKPVDAACPTQ